MENKPRKPIGSIWRETEKKAHLVDGRQHPRKPLYSFWGQKESQSPVRRARKPIDIYLRSDGRQHPRKPLSSYWGKPKAA
jgi:hypothetical protein